MFKQVRLHDAILKFYQRSQPIAFSNAETLYDDLVLLRDQILMYGDLSEAQTNYLNEFIEQFDTTLTISVRGIFEKWLSDGFLLELIRDIINEEVVVARDGESKLNIRLNRDKQDTDDKIDLLQQKDIQHTTQLTQNNERITELEVFNVKDYGAVGDGITNDTQAFKDLTADINLMEYVKVKIPAGIYIIDEKMMFRVNNSQLIFEGEIKLKDGMETPFGLVGFSGRNNTIIGLSVDGNNANAIDEGRAGVSSLVNFGNCSNVVFKNFKLKNSMYSAITCAGGNYDITFDGLEFTNIGEHCMYLSGGNNHKFYFNDIVVNGFGMYNERGQSLVQGHACFVIKSRNDTNGPSSKWEAKNFNVNRLSDLFHGNAILGITDVLKDFDIKNVEADCYLVNSLGMPENFKMSVDNAKCQRITFGEMINKCVVEVNNCETVTLEGHLFNFKSVSNSTFNSSSASSSVMRDQIQDFTTEISNCVFNFVENARFNVGEIRNNVYFQNCVFNKDESGSANLIFNFAENPTKQTFIFFEKSVFNIQSYLFTASQELLNVIVDLCYKPSPTYFSGNSINYIVNNHIPTLLAEQQQTP